MNFRDFVGAAEVHLRMTGWLMHGHNGVWRKYKKPGGDEILPLPGALCAEVRENNVFEPTIERYLVENGWRRTSSGVSSGWPTYRKGDNKAKKLPEALLKQLMDDRNDRAAVSPRTTPSEMKKLLDVTMLRNGSPPPSGGANTAPARR